MLLRCCTQVSCCLHTCQVEVVLESFVACAACVGCCSEKKMSRRHCLPQNLDRHTGASGLSFPANLSTDKCSLTCVGVCLDMIVRVLFLFKGTECPAPPPPLWPLRGGGLGIVKLPWRRLSSIFREALKKIDLPTVGPSDPTPRWVPHSWVLKSPVPGSTLIIWQWQGKKRWFWPPGTPAFHCKGA